MSVQALGLRAYSDALQHFNKVDGSLKQGMPVGKQTLFSHTLDQSLLRDSVDKGETFGARPGFIRYPDQQHTPVTPSNSFGDTIKGSLNKVNERRAPRPRPLTTSPRAVARTCMS